jgi:hypothetical protein
MKEVIVLKLSKRSIGHNPFQTGVSGLLRKGACELGLIIGA